MLHFLLRKTITTVGCWRQPWRRRKFTHIYLLIVYAIAVDTAPKFRIPAVVIQVILYTAK
jgi:hypothetical protein